MNTVLVIEHVKNIRGLVDNLDKIMDDEISFSVSKDQKTRIYLSIKQRLDDIKDRLLEIDNEVLNLKQSQES